MHFSLPLSNDKDLAIDTSNSYPLKIISWDKGQKTMELTRNETIALFALLQDHMDQISKDLKK